MHFKIDRILFYSFMLIAFACGTESTDQSVTDAAVMDASTSPDNGFDGSLGFDSGRDATSDAMLTTDAGVMTPVCGNGRI